MIIMGMFNLSYCRWLFDYLAKSLGFWGLLGGLLIVASLLGYFHMINPLKLQITQAEQELKQANNASNIMTKVVSPIQSQQEEINKFYLQFPKISALQTQLGVIESKAKQNHLSLNKGDYKLIPLKNGQFIRYEFVLPLEGKYTHIRHFIADVLTALPTLALNDFQIKRDNTLVPTVQAKLGFVLFLKGESL